MMKTAAKKRKRIENRMDIRTYFDKENLPPGIVCSPPKKKPKAVPGLKTETCLPLGPRDANGGGSLIKPRYHRLPSMDSSVKEERMTGQEGLKQYQEVQLSEESPEEIPLSTETVETHFPKTYKTRFPTNKRERWQRVPVGVSDVVSESGRGGPRSCEAQSQEISEAPRVNRWVESRFPGNCKLEAPQLRNEDFHLQEKWRSVCQDIGRSVCKIVVHQVSQGTGFVLIDRLIKTNAHLFSGFLHGDKLKDHISVSVVFELEARKLSYAVEKILVDFDEQLDYAVLALIPEGQRANQPSTLDMVEVPPGLLRRFGPVPENGEVCIIGHPAGGEKTFENTFIIEAEDRKIAVKDYLAQYKDLIKKLVEQSLVNQGINDIMTGGIKAKLVITYFSSMYEGTSGSPVAYDRFLIGMHTGGYGCRRSESTIGVMAYSIPELTIFKKILENLKKKDKKDLLGRFLVESQGNRHLEKIIDDVGLNQNKDQSHYVENQERKEKQSDLPDSEEEMDTS
ncbi:uncharacterized protein LOC124881109 [Girardinichthys multiradiatus]|uniref:uncharacterized protein LOC124881109 n=1 Tax=Girardinichthys multiradiatus TaxID=208333 RepID=UPI001FAC0133|nr:uncharacterized protein LOC124881109 [Girardinichthys multiradiatus]XP_047242575.1 uncharacterized protein LOC124881109 [Girardinichthys multiradiatus]